MSALYAWLFISVGNVIYAAIYGDYPSAFEHSWYQGWAIAIYHLVWRE